MRILYVTSGFPYPLTSGYLRHYHLIRELSQRHRVTLLSLAGAAHRPEDVDGVRGWTDEVRVFRDTRRGGTWGRLARRARTIARGRSPAIGRLLDAAATLDRDAPFDAIVLSGKSTEAVLDRLPDRPAIVDLCDATSLRIAGAMAHATPLRRLVLAADLRSVRAVERRLMARAAWRLFASARDRDALLAAGSGHRGAADRTTVVPNGVDSDFWRRGATRLGRETIVFTGAMHYAPNADAARFLITKVLPRVRRRLPATRLQVVGRDPGPDLVRLGAATPGVTVTGWVDDVRPYLDEASVFAAPLRFGAGIQNKVLEAMSMEVPVVASELAAAGLRVDDGPEPPIDVADGAEATASRLVERLSEATADGRPHAAGRDYVASRFRWGRSGQLLADIIETVVRGGTAVPSADGRIMTEPS